MHHHRLLGLLVGALTIVPAQAALAGPTVNVRVEGGSATLLSKTVTLPDVKAPGNPCTEANANVTVAAALEEATRGNWDRQSFAQTILGEARNTGNAYWAEWLNEGYGGGICADVVQTGDRVLFIADNFGPGFEPTAFPLVLKAPATAAPGAPFTVTATEYRTDGLAPARATPSEDLVITGGAAPATTGAQGTASVRIDQRGPTQLRAARANATRAEPITVCVTDGADGFCGTSLPGAPPSAAAPPAPPAAPDEVAAFAKIRSVEEGERFARGRGPRTLSGTVDDDQAGVQDVRLRLSRTDRSRTGRKACTRYDGVAERFVRTRRCGVKNARTFSVSSSPSFRYLLPSALPRGRYVLDVIVIDRERNQTTTYQRGRNRVVFFVG